MTTSSIERLRLNVLEANNLTELFFIMALIKKHFEAEFNEFLRFVDTPYEERKNFRSNRYNPYIAEVLEERCAELDICINFNQFYIGVGIEVKNEEV